MDDTEDDERYPPNPYGINHGYRSSHHTKLLVRNASYPQHVGNQYVEDDDNLEVREEEEEEDDNDDNDDNDEYGIQQNGRCDDDDDDDDDDEEGEDDNPNDYSRRIESVDNSRQQKKRKMKSLLSSYEFAPRVAAATSTSKRKPFYGGWCSLSDWTEHETLILLDAWGDRFLQRGRKSLRSEEWQEVAGKVSQESKHDRSDTQCQNRLATLKKKYKKEKMKLEGIVGPTSKWVYFKKMDMLLSSTSQQTVISCGLDSRENVFRNPRVYLNRPNGLDKMRDGPENSESEENGSDFLPPKRTNRGDGASFRLRADSIQRFSDIYEKIESSKRQQMLELEKMRMNFHRGLETQKRQMLERAQAEIAKIRQGDDEENDVSAKNVSG